MPADASSQSSSMVAQFDIAARSRTRRATQWRPEVSSTHASGGSAMMNELLYAPGLAVAREAALAVTLEQLRDDLLAPRPRCRRARGRAARDPSRAGRSPRAASRVYNASLPIATPRSFTPCSKPQSHHGRLPSTASVSRHLRDRRRTGSAAGSPASCARRGARKSGWHSSGGRSLFLANRVCPSRVCGPSTTRVSQLVSSGSLHRAHDTRGACPAALLWVAWSRP